MKKVSFTILFISLLCSFCFSQKMDVNKEKALAQQYYQNGDYEKAAELFERLWSSANTNQTFYYSYLFRSVLNIKDYARLEKIVKKQIKKYKTQPRYVVDLGYVYSQSGELDKAKKEYEGAIKSLPASNSQIRMLASSFQSYRESDYVIKVYEQGNVLMKDDFYYGFEIGSAYINKGDYKKGTIYLLGYLDRKPNEIQRVKNTFQRSKDKKAAFNQLETQLYDKIQKSPEVDMYPEMLIWIFIQRKDFESALIQAKAIDRRKSGDGSRVMKIARSAVTEKNYNEAIEAYEYVLEKGTTTKWHIPAKKEILNTRKKKLADSYDYTNEDIQELKKDYISFIDEYGKNKSTAQTIIELAQLEAFYIHDINEAVSLLEDLVSLQGINKKTINKSKLDLGDFYIILGDVWEATLLYSQVDKSEKDTELGEEARFRNARLSYYKGEFDWSQAQLKILKASTSELIANDALNLSIFITDNLGLDTTVTPMEMYSRAELFIFQNKDEDAEIVFDSLNEFFPSHKLDDDILYQRAELALRKKDYDKASTHLQQIITMHRTDLLGDDATFLLAEINERYLDNTEQAMKLYKTILLDYSDSVLIVEARKRFRKLRGDNQNSDDNL